MQQAPAPAEQQGAPQPPAAPQRAAEEEEPIWVRRERERAAQKEAGGSGELPFGVYLLFSSFVAIAAVSRLPAVGGARLHSKRFARARRVQHVPVCIAHARPQSGGPHRTRPHPAAGTQLSRTEHLPPQPAEPARIAPASTPPPLRAPPPLTSPPDRLHLRVCQPARRV